MINEKHPFLEYRIFELVQMNEFLNHQIAHNTVFVFVEADLGDFVFEIQKQSKKDPALLERAGFAFGLLEAIRRVEMPFIFKGGIL